MIQNVPFFFAPRHARRGARRANPRDEYVHTDPPGRCIAKCCTIAQCAPLLSMRTAAMETRCARAGADPHTVETGGAVA